LRWQPALRIFEQARGGHDVEDDAGGPIVAARACKVQGLEEDVVVFKGVPYAKPRVGALRWTRPSTDPVPEAGIRKATHCGPECIPTGNAPMSEDCLFANVWGVCYRLTRRHDPTIKTFLEWLIGEASGAPAEP